MIIPVNTKAPGIVAKKVKIPTLFGLNKTFSQIL